MSQKKGEKRITGKMKSERIDEEMVCVDSLLHDLRENCGCRDIQYQRELNDPPDFWVTISGEKYAVEVTSIVLDYSYDARCQKLESRIQEISLSKHLLKGNYALEVMGRPNIPKNTSVQWKDLESKATDYVKRTKELTSTPRMYLLNNRDGYVAIQKLSDTGASVGLAGPVEVKWGVEAKMELSNLIQNRIDTKHISLERVLPKCPNVIILFYDAYGFCEIDDALESFRKVRGYDWTHSIFWVASFTSRPNELDPKLPGRTGVFLYSKNYDWMKV